MFAGFRRFQRVIWLAAAIIIIPPFVIFFSPQAGQMFSGRGGVGEFGKLGGETITQSQFLDARKEAFFRMRMYTGRWPDNDAERLTEFTYYQLLIAQQIKEQGIHVSDEAVRRTATSFGVSDLDTFMKMVPRNPYSITKEDFIRFCEHETGFRELTQLASVSGQLLPPRDIESKFRKQSEESMVEAVFFNWADHTNGVSAAADAVARYYTNSQSQYRLPERIAVSYVEFAKSDFLSQGDAAITQRITNLTAFVDAEYQRQGGTNFTDPKNPLVVLPEKDAKEQLRDRIRGEFSLIAAYNKATEVADRMMNLSNQTAQAFEGFLSAEKLPVKVSSPFDRNQSPVELKGLTSEFASRAFELTNPASAILFAPIRGEDGVFLVALKQRIPSQVEPLESVRSKVTADYIKSQGRDLSSRAGNAFYSSLTNQLPAGKSFAEVAAWSRLKIETLPPFSLSTETLPELAGRLELNTLKNTASRMTNGAVSRYTFTSDGGVVLHLRERKPVSDAVRKEKFTAFQQEERLSRMNEALGRWFDKVAQAKLQRPAREQREGQAQTQR